MAARSDAGRETPDAVDRCARRLLVWPFTRRHQAPRRPLDSGSRFRSLDAIHLATALSLGDLDFELATYDDRLAVAARAHGLRVVQPGR